MKNNQLKDIKTKFWYFWSQYKQSEERIYKNECLSSMTEFANIILSKTNKNEKYYDFYFSVANGFWIFDKYGEILYFKFTFKKGLKAKE